MGESGCGKSTVARTLLRLEKATSGQAYFDGEDIFGMSRGQLRQWRRRVQMIFQDPYGSLDPRGSVREIISEPWVVHSGIYPIALPTPIFGRSAPACRDCTCLSIKA